MRLGPHLTLPVKIVLLPLLPILLAIAVVGFIEHNNKRLEHLLETFVSRSTAATHIAVEISAIHADLLQLVEFSQNPDVGRDVAYRRGRDLLDRFDSLVEASDATGRQTTDTAAGLFTSGIRESLSMVRDALVSAVDAATRDPGLAKIAFAKEQANRLAQHFIALNLKLMTRLAAIPHEARIEHEKLESEIDRQQLALKMGAAILVLLIGFTIVRLAREISRLFVQTTHAMSQLQSGNTDVRIDLDGDSPDILALKNGLLRFREAQMEATQYRQGLEHSNTMLSLARATAETANLAKSQFLSSMSHELRTPLNAILGYAQLFGMDPQLSQDSKDNVQEIKNAGQHLLVLINDMIDLSRIETDDVQLSMEPVALNTISADCFPMVVTKASEMDITLIDAQGSGYGAVIQADKIRLRQVIINFLSNAIKYNRLHGTVTLECTIKDTAVRIAVADTGTGIPAKLQSRLFTPFDRLGKENGPIEGTGIGLLIAKRIVEAMDGRMGFESAEDQGSTFWVEFPILTMGKTA
jgi:signal transduction histidine kinase